MEENYYTARGYQKISALQSGLTPSLEDYMEMIYRIILRQGNIKGNELAAELHVKPSSVTKMLVKLTDLGYLDYEKYGVIKLTDEGIRLGEYLLWRHNTITEFFTKLNSNPSEAFMEAERAEHLLSPQSVIRLEQLNQVLKDIDF